MRENALEPVTLVRSPMFTKRISLVTLNGSKPASFIAGIVNLFTSLLSLVLMMLPLRSRDRKHVAFALLLR